MRFKDSHPEWTAYDSKLSIKDFPAGLQQQLHGLIAHYSRDEDADLKKIVNAINGAILKQPTTNWGYDFLINDLEDSVSEMFRARFDRAMDAIYEVVNVLPREFVNDLNDLFDENKFGYRLEWTLSYPGYEWEWQIVDDAAAATVKSASETALSVDKICQQTADHLRQLIENLSRDNDRARKDAVRDAMSATEALLAQVSGKSDIADATKELQASQSWGPKLIIRDGLSIWNHLHQAHGDIRHGNPNATPLPREEALYWIERMLAYVNYIARVQRTKQK